MSSTRNSVRSRSYRERPQPLSRAQRYPLLEKHRDYALRAKDHNAKKKRLKILREKARDRNPDEFAFGMMSAGRAGQGKKRGKGNTGGLVGAEDTPESGVRLSKRAMERDPVLKGDEVGKGLKQETVKLLKNQDQGFLRVMRGRVRKEIERLKGTILFGDRPGDQEVAETDEDDERPTREGLQVLGSSSVDGLDKKNHTVFVDDTEKQTAFDPGEYFDTEDAHVHHAHNRRRRSSGGAGYTDDKGGARAALAAKPLRRSNAESRAETNYAREHTSQAAQRDKLARKLSTLESQERELAIAERELELQRAKMNGDYGGVDKNGVKYKVRRRKK